MAGTPQIRAALTNAPKSEENVGVFVGVEMRNVDARRLNLPNLRDDLRH